MLKTFKNTLLKNYWLTIRSYFSVIGFTITDPIEQYDLGTILIGDYYIYPIYFHIILLVGLTLVVLSSIKLNFLGYINYKIYSFIREAFLSVCGVERQLLFPYFYYIFFFLLLSNICGMLP